MNSSMHPADPGLPPTEMLMEDPQSSMKAKEVGGHAYTGSICTLNYHAS